MTPPRSRDGARSGGGRPTRLVRDGVRRQAAGLILVHNHPSGDPSPSPDDLHLTAEAVAAGRAGATGRVGPVSWQRAVRRATTAPVRASA